MCSSTPRGGSVVAEAGAMVMVSAARQTRAATIIRILITGNIGLTPPSLSQGFVKTCKWADMWDGHPWPRACPFRLRGKHAADSGWSGRRCVFVDAGQLRRHDAGHDQRSSQQLDSVKLLAQPEPREQRGRDRLERRDQRHA